MCRKYIPAAANILNGKFGIAAKYEETSKEMRKEILIVHRHRGQMKQSLVYNTSMAWQKSKKSYSKACYYSFKFTTHM